MLTGGTEAQAQQAGAADRGGAFERWLAGLIDRELIDAFLWLQREYLRPHRRALATAFLFTWLSGATTALLVWLVKPALSTILEGGRPELVFGLVAAVASSDRSAGSPRCRRCASRSGSASRC